MINLRLDFYECRSTSNPWLQIKGRVPNASVGGLEGWSPTCELKKFAVWGANHAHGEMQRASACDPY